MLEFQHSVNLRNFFSHDTPEGCGLSHRIFLATSFGGGRAGENIAKGQSTPEKTRIAWQNSPGHRLNMLGPLYTRIGIASGLNKAGEITWVAVFGAKDSDALPQPLKPDNRATSMAPRAVLPTGPDTKTNDPSEASSNTLQPAFQCKPGFEIVVSGSAPNEFRYCKNGKNVSGMITAAMRKLCIEWGGGTAACSSDVWNENLYLSARGANLCPRGTRMAPADGRCKE